MSLPQHLMCEFDDDLKPSPRRGLTSIAAAMFLSGEFPRLPNWTCWVPQPRYRQGLSRIVGDNDQKGRINDWSWERVAMSYPVVSYRVGHPLEKYYGWSGMIRIRGAEGADFFLFSYLDSTGSIGKRYFATITDHELLSRFAHGGGRYLQHCTGRLQGLYRMPGQGSARPFSDGAVGGRIQLCEFRLRGAPGVPPVSQAANIGPVRGVS